MPASPDKIAERVFETLKGFGLQLSLFDEDGNRTADPTVARRFFAKPGSMLVSYKEDGENSEINLYLSEHTDTDGAKKLMEQLRRLSVHFNVQFNTRKYGKEITPKDFAFVGESRGINMDKVEEARNPMTGSMKSSYQNWNSAKLIVRHTKPVAEDIVGSRSRNIQKIFVETIEGERFKFPVVHLGGARAIARHVGAGGTFYDKVGQHIIGLSEEFKDMQKVSAHIYRNRASLNEGAFDLRESVRSRIDEIRHELGRFMTIAGYQQKVEEVETTEASPLNEESLMEKVSALKTMLQIDESDASLDIALGRVAPMFAEDKPEVDVDPAMVELIRKAYGEGEARDSEFVDAARLLSDPRQLEFGPPTSKSQATKAELGNSMSPMSKLAWKLGAISERMLPKSDGAFIISAILSRIAAKIDQALDSQGPHAKVGVNPAQKQIIQMFLKQVAPVIGESMKAAGHNDWDLTEAAPLGHGTGYPDKELLKKKFAKDKENELKKKGVSILKPKKEGVSYKEAREISEWFENFDPLTIIKESAKKEAEVEEGKEEEIEEKHEEIKESKVLNKDEAWWIADFLVRGEASATDIATCYEGADCKVIAEVLQENWTNETTEAIIKDLSVTEDEEVVEKCGMSHTIGQKKRQVNEYTHSSDEDSFIWFADEESLLKAKSVLDARDERYHAHNNEVDHGLEFSGPKIRNGYAVLFSKDPELNIIAEPEMGPYDKAFGTSKHNQVVHPELERIHKDPRDPKDISVATPPTELMMGEKVTIGGDKGKAFKKDVQSAKERQKRHEAPAGQTKRATEIGQSKKDLKARDYQ